MENILSKTANTNKNFLDLFCQSPTDGNRNYMRPNNMNNITTGAAVGFGVAGCGGGNGGGGNAAGVGNSEVLSLLKENKHLKAMLILHLDLIQEQSDQLLARERQINMQSEERTIFCSKMQEMENKIKDFESMEAELKSLKRKLQQQVKMCKCMPPPLAKIQRTDLIHKNTLAGMTAGNNGIVNESNNKFTSRRMLKRISTNLMSDHCSERDESDVVQKTQETNMSRRMRERVQRAQMPMPMQYQKVRPQHREQPVDYIVIRDSLDEELPRKKTIAKKTASADENDVMIIEDDDDGQVLRSEAATTSTDIALVAPQSIEKDSQQTIECVISEEPVLDTAILPAENLKETTATTTSESVAAAAASVTLLSSIPQDALEQDKAVVDEIELELENVLQESPVRPSKISDIVTTNVDVLAKELQTDDEDQIEENACIVSQLPVAEDVHAIAVEVEQEECTNIQQVEPISPAISPPTSPLPLTSTTNEAEVYATPIIQSPTPLCVPSPHSSIETPAQEFANMQLTNEKVTEDYTIESEKSAEYPIESEKSTEYPIESEKSPIAEQTDEEMLAITAEIASPPYEKISDAKASPLTHHQEEDVEEEVSVTPKSPALPTMSYEQSSAKNDEQLTAATVAETFAVAELQTETDNKVGIDIPQSTLAGDGNRMQIAELNNDSVHAVSAQEHSKDFCDDQQKIKNEFNSDDVQEVKVDADQHTGNDDGFVNPNLFKPILRQKRLKSKPKIDRDRPSRKFLSALQIKPRTPDIIRKNGQTIIKCPINIKPTIFEKSDKNTTQKVKLMYTHSPYTTLEWEDGEQSCVYEFSPEDAKALRVQDPKVEIPLWNVRDTITILQNANLENLCDKAYLDRHEKHVEAEKRRKRWDNQQMRELRHNEHLRKASEKKKRLANAEEAFFWSFYPMANEVKYIRITKHLPVQAFGFNVALLPTNGFFRLPWLHRFGGNYGGSSFNGVMVKSTNARVARIAATAAISRGITTVGRMASSGISGASTSAAAAIAAETKTRRNQLPPNRTTLRFIKKRKRMPFASVTTYITKSAGKTVAFTKSDIAMRSVQLASENPAADTVATVMNDTNK